VFDQGGKRKTVEDGYNLVLIVAGELKALRDGEAFFSLEGMGRSFLQGFLSDGSMLNVEQQEKGDAAEVGVVLRFTDKKNEPLKIRLKRPAKEK
jgi:hypothetical protein